MMNSKNLNPEQNQELITPFSPLPQKREINKQVSVFKISLKGMGAENSSNQIPNNFKLGTFKNSRCPFK